MELIIAFTAGLISFLSPCVLPLIPGYISYISGASLGDIVEKQKKVKKPQQNKIKGKGFIFFDLITS